MHLSMPGDYSPKTKQPRYARRQVLPIPRIAVTPIFSVGLLFL